MKQYKYVILNSSLLFIIATILEMTLHECGHFVTAFYLQAQNLSLHHNYVDYAEDNLNTNYKIAIAAAGPIVSLLIGMLFHFICSKQTNRNLLFLFNLYMAIFGYIGFFGYLMIAPMVPVGDTGFIFLALNFPMWFIILIAVTGIAVLYLLQKKLTKYFAEMGTNELIADSNLRKPFIHCLIQYPLYIGIVITALLNFPVPVLISLIAPICSPMTIMWSYGDALKKTYPAQNTNAAFEKLNSIQPVLFILLIIIVAINRLLVPGIHVN